MKSLENIASHEAVPKRYFSSSFINEAPGEAISDLHWGGEINETQLHMHAVNRRFAQLFLQAHVSPNNFKNSSNFTKDAASGPF
jgi:hypothetical protein